MTTLHSDHIEHKPEVFAHAIPRGPKVRLAVAEVVIAKPERDRLAALWYARHPHAYVGPCADSWRPILGYTDCLI